MLPGLICQEVLASLAAVGARPSFYHVDERLHADLTSVREAGAVPVRAVVAVNYFGFPQPLEAIRELCRTWGAGLIEDNAHGFLSTDGRTPLGRRGDAGIFSLRKSLLMPNGAALVDNRPTGGLPASVDGVRCTASPFVSEWRYWLAGGMKRVMASAGPWAVRAVLALLDGVHRTDGGAGNPSTSAKAERLMPQEVVSPLATRILRRCDVLAEQQRRRALYRLVDRRIASYGGRPVFPGLPAGVVPYGYPFYAARSQIRRVTNLLRNEGLRCTVWPHLPQAIQRNAPEHYRSLWYIPFLW
mgnify:CR=1 FL=1